MGRTVEMPEDEFIGLLWERVSNSSFNSYDDDFWDITFDWLSQAGWLEPRYNYPSYIVDNIAVNGDIVDKSEQDLTEDEIQQMIDDGDILYETKNYLVFNLGL